MTSRVLDRAKTVAIELVTTTAVPLLDIRLVTEVIAPSVLLASKNRLISPAPAAPLAPGVKVAVFVKESTDRVKMSFRSVGNYSVRDLAEQHFDGGGHHNAAGGASRESIGVVMARLRGLLPEIASGITAAEKADETQEGAFPQAAQVRGSHARC